jgi:membrane protease YdiL (CAAX protease family)
MPLEEKTAPTRAGAPARGWRRSRWLALLEMVLVALIFVADARHLIPVSKTPFLFLLAWLSLRLRRVGWRGVGFARFRTWKSTLGLGLTLGIATESFQLLVTQPFLAWVIGKQPDLEEFKILRGNLSYSLIALGLTWSLAAFGEEMVWRGYLLNRVSRLLGEGRLAWTAGTLIVSAAFGLAHSYQGATGIIEESLAGLWLALIYLGSRRNLALPILAHGVQDTLDVLLLYFGRYPGT